MMNTEASDNKAEQEGRAMYEYQAKYRGCGLECCSDWQYSPVFTSMRDAVNWYDATFGFDCHKEIVFFAQKNPKKENA